MTTVPFAQANQQLQQCQLSRLLSTADALAVANLLADADPWTTLGISAKTLENYLLRDDLALHRYVVHKDGNIAGVICIRYPWLRGPYIELLGLATNYRGLGIGKQLLDWAETETRRECKNLWVVTSSFNTKALQFYQRHGFYVIGTIDGLVCPEHDEILLRKCWD